MWWASIARCTFWNLFRIVTLWSSIFGVSWDLNQNLSLSLFILSQAVSSYLCVHLLSSLGLSQLPAPMPRISWSFSPSPLLFCSSLHTYAALPPSLSRSVFPFSFPPLSPGNQTSGEECWVSTFPEKRTIWATQRPTMDPLCSRLPSLGHSCTHTHTQICTEIYENTYTLCLLFAFSYLPPHLDSFTFLCMTLSFIFSPIKSFLFISCFSSVAPWCSHWHVRL